MKSKSTPSPLATQHDEYWTLYKAMFDEYGLVKQHLQSYNTFIEKGLNEIVKEMDIIEPDVEGFKIKLEGIRIGQPKIKEADGAERIVYPMECRIRNLNYSAPLYLTMRPIIVEDGVEKPQEPEEAFIGNFPVMLKSKICLLHGLSKEELIEKFEDPEDPGGYFIVGGSERVIVCQEYLVSNKTLVEKHKKGGAVSASAKIFSTLAGFRSLVTVERRRDGLLRVNFYSIPRPLKFAVLIKALGITVDREIMNLITNDPELIQEVIPTLRESAEITNQEEALDYIGRRVAIGQTREYRIIRAQYVLDNYLLPHLGKRPEDRWKKALFLGQMALETIRVDKGLREPDDKDHYANKRLKLAGEMLKSLFRTAFKSLYKDIKYQLEKNVRRGRKLNLRTALRADVITERVRHALATGNWVGGKAGVSQLLDRTNYMSTYSHLRRVISPLVRSQAHFEARDLHPSHWGKICPNETPEGPNCGLVKNLALQAYISEGCSEEIIINFLKQQGELVQFIAPNTFDHGATKINLNGTLIATTRNPEELIQKIIKARRSGKLSPEINVGFNEDEKSVSINTDSGRVRRPLLIVENGKPLLKKEHINRLKKGDMKFSDLIKLGVVEFLDAEEEENAYIALRPEDLTPEHTHLEISPAAILGICASVIPYAEHNQSPRNTYEAGMTKQALGLYAANFRYRADRRSHLLQHPQIPLVGTKPMEIIGFNRRPAGQNFIVAILSYYGWNIEDAIIFNKASIERGLARSHFFRSYIAEEKRYVSGQEDKFEIPKQGVRGYRTEVVYRHLSEEDGIIEPEIEVKGGDVLIGRTSRLRFLDEYTELEATRPERRETSIFMRHGEKGFVDTVIITETDEGEKLVKVKVRDQRIPELGDKFASRHGQKGVIGFIANQEDLPFTEDGITPDIIINPHAIPGRMTLGQIIESMAAIVAAMQGKPVDATIFEGDTPDIIAENLRKWGFYPYGETVLYDGVTGQMMPARVFMGPVYYQKLHHLAADKIHARARGPIQILTRQPTEGRAREGGLRFGEMERDCLVGHGTAILLKERLLDESDRTEVFICENCGMLAVYDRRHEETYCPVCGTKDIGISKVVVSYAFKLLLQELMSLMIRPKLILEEYTAW